jgi:hypothetical protein
MPHSDRVVALGELGGLWTSLSHWAWSLGLVIPSPRMP